MAERSIDHVAFVPRASGGTWEYWVRAGEIWRADTRAPVMPDGYRSGRWYGADRESTRANLLAASRPTQRITHGLTVHTVTLDDTLGITCPACGSDDVGQWAHDGESETADYWECNRCDADGSMLAPEGLVTANGHPVLVAELARGLLAAHDEHGILLTGERRTATVTGARTEREVAAYLPAAYHVTGSHVDEHDRLCVTIEGTDTAGWTLTGYVIPRLASGLMQCAETARQ